MTIEERAHHLYHAETDPAYREMFLALIDDPNYGDAFFVNACVMTYDPRNGPHGKPIGPTPFLLWEAQEKAVTRIGQAIDQGFDLGGEKSRDQGMTWLFLAAIVKRWLRQRGFSALIGTMTEDLVDNAKSPASLGWKIDFILENLPGFLLPPGYNKREHRSWCNWVNPANGATITGRAPTPRYPVGDRKSCIYYDDWAQWEHGLSAWENGAATSNCRMASWTVNRDAPLNHAYQLAKSKGAFEGVRTEIVNLYWKEDPRKQATAIDPETGKEYNIWLRSMIGDPERGIPGKISVEQFLRDYEMIYELASKGRIYSQQLPHVRIGNFKYDKRFPLYTLWDYGRTDDAVIVWVQWDFDLGRIRAIDAVARSGQEIGYYIPFVKGRENPQEVLPYEASYTPEDWAVIERHEAWQVYNPHLNRRGIRYADHFGDPAGRQRTMASNKSAVEQLADADIIVHDMDTNRAKSYRGRIDDLRYLLPLLDIDEENCKVLVTALQNYKWNKEGTAPEHDEHSHACAALEYGAVNLITDIKAWYEAQRKAKAIAAAGRDYVTFGDERAAGLVNQWGQPLNPAQNRVFGYGKSRDAREYDGAHDPAGY